MLEKERGKLPRVDCNAVEELNAYVARQYRNDDLEYLHIYIFGLEEGELRLSPIGRRRRIFQYRSRSPLRVTNVIVAATATIPGERVDRVLLKCFSIV